MQIEKKLIAWSILALVIGVAAILPLQYLMTGQAEAKAQITPWFDFGIPYAYVNLQVSGGNDTMTWDGAMFQAIANFTLTSDAINLKNADAQIEFYQFRLYSDTASIVNITYSVAVCREELNVPGIPGAFTWQSQGLEPTNSTSQTAPPTTATQLLATAYAEAAKS